MIVLRFGKIKNKKRISCGSITVIVRASLQLINRLMEEEEEGRART